MAMAQNGDSDESNFRLRPYQEEMLEASLRGNVIVKMDTGSGKTAIAIVRAEAALQSCEQDKFVWVLAPTVVLSTQHSQTFGQRLPGYQLRLLIGSDGLDRWSDQATWDAALKNMRIIISTYSVLNDALNNGFVRFEKLALLIFDEVHNCIGDNPGALLMRNFYSNATHHPAILGLSASIIDPDDIEDRFDARVITPRKSRSELLRHANRPVLQYMHFGHSDHSRTLRLIKLEDLKLNYLRELDPWVKSLEEEERHRFLMKGKPTLCEKEITAIFQKANHVFEQLGPSMADYFIENTVRAMLRRIDVAGRLNADSAMIQAEALHLSWLLQPLVSPSKKRKCDRDTEHDKFAYMNFSPKLHELLEFLEKEWTESFTGLIFVQQRALAYTLAHLLSVYPFQRAKIRVQGFVGTSKVADRAKRLIEQVLPQDHNGVLEKFRSPEREINLLVATEVLGEGVDVPQCHLVLCFDPPPRIISFIQKRGRARLKDSKYVLMFEEGMDNSKIAKWQRVEAELDEAYQAEERLWQISKQLEERAEPDAGKRQFRIDSTGALLDHNNAVPKLFHLCQSLQSQGWVDSRPQFAYKESWDKTITATVTLPLFFPPELRTSRSSQAWLTEKVAKRDAAYEVLVKLYENGLLNEHLLPLKEDKKDEDEVEMRVKKPSFCDVLPAIDPWFEVAKEADISRWHTLRVIIAKDGEEHNSIPLTLLVPMPLPPLPKFTLFWNAKVQYTVTGSLFEPRLVSSAELWTMREFTEDLLRSASGKGMPFGVNDFPFVIELSSAEVAFWSEERKRNVLRGLIPAQRSQHGALRPGIVWNDKHRYLFQRFATTKLTEEGLEQDVIEVTTYPKRRDFMHHFKGNHSAYTQKHMFPQSECTVEISTFNATLVSFFLPAILRRIELGLITQKLYRTLIPHLSFEALPMLQASITTREAREAENYERLEFLGDAYINFLTSLNLMVEQPLWPEGYLTEEKGRRVSNDTFSNAALRVGLDQYIVSKAFTGQKWAPPYVHKLVTDTTGAEGDMSTVRYQSSKKRVADVVEATIAVAYLDGGHDFAVKLCETYFPDQTWSAPEDQAAQLFARASDDAVHLERLEDLIGYKFKKPSLLLEAMTSGAYKGGDCNARSYERLEFLGDAILDYVVVKRIYVFKGRELPHHAMHSIKTATVNAWILGFLCMEHFSLEARENVVMKSSSSNSRPVPEVEEQTIKKHIWQFIRPGNRGDKELKSLEKFEQMRVRIREAFETGKKYPWPLLCRFNPVKIFSDVIESILGAIYVDTHANNEVCDAFLEHIGLYKILDRLLSENVACMHPKELLGIAADRRRVDYVYGEENKMVTCHVLIDGKQVGEASMGETREIAGTIAAERAVEIEQRGKTYDMVEKAWKAVSEDKLDVVELNDSSIECGLDGIGGEQDEDSDDDFDILAETRKHFKPVADDAVLFG